jgi:hypothetical protein
MPTNDGCLLGFLSTNYNGPKEADDASTARDWIAAFERTPMSAQLTLIGHTVALLKLLMASQQMAPILGR